MLHPQPGNIEDAEVQSLSSIMPEKHGSATQVVLAFFRSNLVFYFGWWLFVSGFCDLPLP
jgi:hypothetical protein